MAVVTTPARQPEGRLKRLDEFTLTDLESVGLILRGDSIIDWHRLDLHSDDEVLEFLHAHELRPDEPADVTRMETLKAEAIGYLRRQFEYPIPKPVEQATVPELLLLASSRGHRQTCACTILKCMHIIHHLDGRELLFVLPLSDQEVFHAVEEKVYRVIGSMLAGGFPIIEFVGGRKNKDSLYTKLLSKQETIAAQIYDKLRFRIVTRTRDDVFPVLQYLTKKLFPFNYVVPGQSINSMFHFRSFCQESPHLRDLVPQIQTAHPDDDLTPGDNTFSAASYRVIHFVVDMPVRLPRRLLERAPSSAWPLGNVIFVICEFQVVDRETDAANELGDASHAKYKERQKKAVMRRLQLGTRDLASMTPLPMPAPPGLRVPPAPAVPAVAAPPPPPPRAPKGPPPPAPTKPSKRRRG